MNSNKVMSFFNPLSSRKTTNNGGCTYPNYKRETVNYTANGADPLIHTSLVTKEDKAKYNTLLNSLDKDSRKQLETALKTGVLLNNDSNDKSSVLDNLYKIATTERAEGLDNKKILKDTLTSIVNPYSITQKFGDIPTEYKPEVIGKLTHNSKNLVDIYLANKQLEDLFSGCCVAASEQFNLSNRKPAEYTRFVEGLSSPKKSVDKEINLDSLSKNTLDAIWLLNSFEISYTPKDFNTVKVKLAPDENAYTRAKIQQDYRDNKERSSVDVLMQSTFMNVASQQSYNALNDKRGGKFSNEDSGLIDYEKTFLETVVEDKNITSVTYQNVDENQNLVGYLADYDTVKNQLLETLNRGNNVIIGYTVTDDNKHIIGAHEITITDYKDKDGKLSFVCNDTDDEIDEPIEYPAEYIIPKIHHAGIPEDIANQEMETTDTWRYNIREMNKNKYKQAS